jgi:hypothetical protein
VTACNHRWQGVIATGSAREDIADGIQPDFTTDFPAPGHELLSTRLVLVSQGLAE